MPITNFGDWGYPTTGVDDRILLNQRITQLEQENEILRIKTREDEKSYSQIIGEKDLKISWYQELITVLNKSKSPGWRIIYDYASHRFMVEYKSKIFFWHKWNRLQHISCATRSEAEEMIEKNRFETIRVHKTFQVMKEIT